MNPKLSVVQQAINPMRKPAFVLRTAVHMGDEAFEKWLLELREGLTAGIDVIDRYFEPKARF